MFLLKQIRIQTNKFSSAIEIFIASVVTPMKIMKFFVIKCYDKGFYCTEIIKGYYVLERRF